MSSIWIGPSAIAVHTPYAVVLTGFASDNAHTLWLALEASGLLTLILLSVRARTPRPEDSHGSSFLRSLVCPLTTLLIVILTNHFLQMAGLPLVERLGQQHYRIAYTGSLLLCGTWITGVWLWNLGSLYRFFACAPGRCSTTEAPPTEIGAAIFSDQGCPPSAKLAIRHHSHVPARLGRYKVLKEIGRGSMGIVYLGKDPMIQRFVAIKTMRLDEADNADKLHQIKARFFREAESTGRLSHPNIVTIYDAGEEQGLGFIAMEVLAGTTLRQWSRPPNLLPLHRLIPTLATVAEALDYAHVQGVVHRDIKPSNIMLTNDQMVKVMDFGIAKTISASDTGTGLVLGTPTYMSPEQIAGKKVDGRSDMFSLGIVLFELLTGRPPFTANNVSALLFAITHQAPTPVKTLRPGLSPMLQDVLNRMLHKDPAQRYHRALELAQHLHACAEELAPPVGLADE